MTDFNSNLPEKRDELNIWLKIVSFLIPIVGAIIYFVKKDKEPIAAKQACNMALIGFVVALILQALSYFFFSANANANY